MIFLRLKITTQVFNPESNGVCSIRIRDLYGQIMEKDAVISVLHYRLQQEQEPENCEEGEGVPLSCPTHPGSSSSYNKGKNKMQ